MFGNWTPNDLRIAAEQHERIAQRYRELADLLDQSAKLFVGAQGPVRERRRNYRTREIFDFLERHGPSTAWEIHEKCGIPLQTVYYVCKKSRGTKFVQDENDHWSLVSQRK